MSLHAQLSPEALEKLHKQQRNQTITSIVIAMLATLFVGLILLFVLLEPVENFTPEIISYQAPKEDSQEELTKEFTRSIQREPAAPSPSMAQVIAVNAPSAIAVPTPDVDVPDISADFGNGDGFGDGFGNGNGDGGGGWTGLPPTIAKRCSKKDRLQRLASNGGNEQCEDAVVRSLRWLKKTQNKNGSWSNNNRVAMTGFALLAYLGHCETSLSDEFGDSVTAAIVYLVDVAIKQHGKLADDIKDNHWPYEHAIATYALGEAMTFSKQLGIHIPNLDKATKMAGDWILEHQHTSGSWDYRYDMSGHRGGDTSIALWHIQALKACKHTGLWEEKAFHSPIRKSLDYLKSKQNKKGGVGYESSSPPSLQPPAYTMTGGAMLAFQIWGKSHSAVVQKGARWVRKNEKFNYNSADCDLYRHYYYVQAMINRGGEDWRFYNAMFRDQILNNQNEDGSYKDVGGGKRANAIAPSYQGGSNMATHYRTCMCTFMLEAYYRFLPATGKHTH